MRRIFFMPILVLFIFSCSEDPFVDGDDVTPESTTVAKPELNENQISTDIELDLESTQLGTSNRNLTIDWCSQACHSERSDCFEWASENRYYRLRDCDRIGTVRTRDVYCTRTVIIGYEDVPVYSPEGELIRIDQVPIYGQEQYVCGTEEYITRTAAEQQQYENCVEDAQEEFVDAIDNCDISFIACDRKCDKPGPK